MADKERVQSIPTVVYMEGQLIPATLHRDLQDPLNDVVEYNPTEAPVSATHAQVAPAAE